ncbi:hypothetical protein [Alkaliphilus crotonatoxidans]
MKKERLHVPYPSDDRIQQEIQIILKKGLPEGEGFLTMLIKMYKQLGLQYIFRDFTEIIFVISLMVLALVTILFNLKATFTVVAFYPMLFTFSPLLYLTTTLFFLIKMKMSSTYEVEMACKYNLYQLAAFKMLVFSIITILINGLLLYWIAGRYEGVNYILAFAISISALFIFSTLLLYGMMETNRSYSKQIVIVGWILGNLLPVYFATELYYRILTSVPVFLYWVLALAGLMVYINKLKKLFYYRSQGGTI